MIHNFFIKAKSICKISFRKFHFRKSKSKYYDGKKIHDVLAINHAARNGFVMCAHAEVTEEAADSSGKTFCKHTEDDVKENSD